MRSRRLFWLGMLCLAVMGELRAQTALTNTNFAYSGAGDNGIIFTYITFNVPTAQLNVYIIMVDVGSGAPKATTAAQVIAGNDGNGNRAAQRFQFLKVSTITQARYGLKTPATYKIQMVAVHPHGPGDSDDVTSAIVEGDFSTADTTAPRLNLGSVDKNDITGRSVAFDGNLNEAGKVHYVVLLATATAPTAAKIKAGTGAQGTTPTPITLSAGSLNYSRTADGLDDGVAYVLYVVGEDTSGNFSTIKKAAFTTVDTTGPVATLTLGTPEPRGITLTLRSNEDSEYFYVIWKELPDDDRDDATVCQSNGLSSLFSQVALGRINKHAPYDPEKSNVDGAAPANGKGNMRADQPLLIEVEGLEPGTLYRAHAIIRDAVRNTAGGCIREGVLSSDPFTTPADTQAPIISHEIKSTTPTGAVISLGRNEPATLYYLLLDAAASAPSSGTVKSPPENSKSGTLDLMSVVKTDLSLSDLSPDTSYKLYVVAVDRASVNSAVLDFPFQTEDNILPTFTSLVVGTVTSTTAQLSIRASERATAYYVVVEESDPVPTRKEVMRQRGGQGITPQKKGKLTVSSSEGTISLEGLDAKKYLIYVFLEDKADNLSGLRVKSFDTRPVGAAGLSPPTYAVGEVTETTIELTSDDLKFSGTANRRRFYVSKSDLTRLVVGNAVDHAIEGVGGEVWTFALGRSRELGTVTIGSGEPEENKKLEPGTRYYVRALDYRWSDGKKSVLSKDLGAMTSGTATPTYIVGGDATTTTITLIEGSEFSGSVNRRRFYVSANDLSELTVTDVVSGVTGGVSGEVWTFVLRENFRTVTIGNENPEENRQLEADTPYYVRVIDYNEGTGEKSSLSAIFEGSTNLVAPSYDLGSATETTITLTGGSSLTKSVNRRRFYVSTNDLSRLSVTSVLDGASSGAADVWTFVLRGGLDEVVIGDPTIHNDNVALVAGSYYYIRAVDYNEDTGERSSLSRTFSTGTLAPRGGPGYKLGTVTENTIELARGTALLEGTDRRRFYVSELNLSPLTIDNVVDGTISGLVGKVWTFVLDGSSVRTVTVGSGEPSGNERLSANTVYFIRAVDYNSSGSMVSPLSGVFSASTLALLRAPSYTVGVATENTITLTGGSDLPGAGYMRRFYVSRNDLSGLSVTNVLDGASSGARDVWTFSLGENLGTVTIGNRNPEENKKLSAGTTYFIRVLDYNATSGKTSPLSGSLRKRTAEGGIDAPEYNVEATIVATTTLVLKEGSELPGSADMRRFYVSKSDLEPLVVENVVDHAIDGVDGEVWTFSLSENLSSVTIGSGEPEGNKELEPGTRYYVRAVDYSASGKTSPLSEDLGGTTAIGTINAPAYNVSATAVTTTTIVLTGGDPLPGNADMRRFYVSRSDLESLVVENAIDHAIDGVDGEVWTFVLGEGEVGTVTIGSGEPKENKKLEPGKRYYVRAVDYNSVSDDVSPLSEDLGKTTTPLVKYPPLPDILLTVGEITATTVEFTSEYTNVDNDKLTWVVVKESAAEVSYEQVVLAYKGETLAVVVAKGQQTTPGPLENTEGSTSGKIDGLSPSTKYTIYAAYRQDTKTDRGEEMVEAQDFTTKEAPINFSALSTAKLVVYAYPNPTSGILHVPMSSGTAVVHNLSGAKVGSFEVSGGQIDLSDLPVGTYVVRLSEYVFRVVKD